MSSPYLVISTPPIANIGVSATSSATTTSGSDVLMTTMTVTPSQGTYLVIFTGVVQQNSAGNSATLSFYIGGTQDATSIIDFAPFDGGALSATTASCCAVTHGVYTVAGAQAVEVRWHVSAGTGTVFQRKLTLIKIG